MTDDAKSNFEARKPDYILKFRNEKSGNKGRIGAAWLNPNGNISIILAPKVCIRQDDLDRITLFLKDL
jgi:hypothetical protein